MWSYYLFCVEETQHARRSSGSRSLCIMRLPLLATFVVPVLSVCARVNTAQSNGWLDRDQVTKRFSLQLDVIGKWVPFTTVKITWPDATEVNIEHYYNIDKVARDDGAARNTAVFRLGRTATNPANFVIMGTGSVSKTPTIDCEAEDALKLPPPSPPHAADCDLVPTYTTLNTWLGNGKTNAGDSVDIRFREWRDAGLVKLQYWGQTGMQVESPVGAVVHGMEVVDGATLITLQLGTSCEERVVDDQGIVVAQPGQTINCVPHRAETMRVTFTLRPPALHPPKVICHAIEPPPPAPIWVAPAAVVPSRPNTAVMRPNAAPASLAHGAWAPVDPSPPPPPPPPPPPVLRVGSTLRSLDDCALGADVRVVQVNSQGDTATLRIEIRPDYWLEGYIFILGVSGQQLDISGEVEHAALQVPTIDATGRLVLFGFQLTNKGGSGGASGPAVSFTLKGGGIQLSQLSCRPAPAPPPADSSEDGYSDHDVSPSAPNSADSPSTSFVFFEMSMSDTVLVSLASFISLLLMWRHRDDICCCCGASQQRAFELPTYEEGPIHRRSEDVAPLRATRHRSEEVTLEMARPPQGRVVE